MMHVKILEESWSFNAVLIGDIDRGPDAINNTLLELLRSSKFIDYKGHSNSVKKHLQNCNVFVLPSYHEECQNRVWRLCHQDGR